MFDCHKQLLSFHNNRLSLPQTMQDGMRERRQRNQKRVRDGLAKDSVSLPVEHIKQGSYAMYTMVQAEYSQSDIDDGVVFLKEDLVGPRGGDLTPRAAKDRVLNAVNHSAFKTPPEIHTNCVRVFYDDGFMLDMPVYRRYEKDNGEVVYELASSEWKTSNPRGVTQWFNDEVISKSPDEVNGRQMRRLVKLLKAWCKSRSSWNMPSGFILSALMAELYPTKESAWLNRDDQALLVMMERIHNRLKWNHKVKHPVVDGYITKSESDTCMGNLQEKLEKAIDTLVVLRDADCDEHKALKAFRTLFATDFFDSRIEELETQKKEGDRKGDASNATVTTQHPSRPVTKDGGGNSYA